MTMMKIIQYEIIRCCDTGRWLQCYAKCVRFSILWICLTSACDL